MTNPNFFPVFMQQLQQQSPQLYQFVQQNPQAFMQLVMQGGAPTGGNGGGNAGGMGGGPVQRTISVSAEEMEAINRLKELGFPEQLCIRAFITCDRNEELAANFLFEQGGAMGGEDAQLQAALAESARMHE